MNKLIAFRMSFIDLNGDVACKKTIMSGIVLIEPKSALKHPQMVNSLR